MAFVVAFVVVNAVTEEVAYRGIAFKAATRAFPPAGAILLPAVAFASSHLSGFPAGAVGVVPSFTYGVALGAIRHLTGGLKFGVLAHMAADATIAFLVIVLAHWTLRIDSSSQMIRLRMYTAKRSISHTTMNMAMSTAATRWNSSVRMAWINMNPTPPAPTIPSTVADRMFISSTYREVPTNIGKACGTTAATLS